MNGWTDQLSSDWTTTDLVVHLGSMRLSRIRFDRPPGKATEQDVIEIHDQEQRLCELVDGILVEKTVGTYEAWLALEIGALLRNFVVPRRLGIVLGADGMLRLKPGLVRIPDVSFVPASQLPAAGESWGAIASFVPALAVEILSAGNTAEEMTRKLHDYFDAGVRLVWYVDPSVKAVHVYRAVDERAVLQAGDALDGGEVLPGLTIPLAGLFAPLAG